MYRNYILNYNRNRLNGQLIQYFWIPIMLLKNVLKMNPLSKKNDLYLDYLANNLYI